MKHGPTNQFDWFGHPAREKEQAAHHFPPGPDPDPGSGLGACCASTLCQLGGQSCCLLKGVAAARRKWRACVKLGNPQTGQHPQLIFQPCPQKISKSKKQCLGGAGGGFLVRFSVHFKPSRKSTHKNTKLVLGNACGKRFLLVLFGTCSEILEGNPIEVTKYS